MRISVRAIIIKDDNFLVMERNRFGHHFMSLIGGAVEANEKLEQALAREVREEASIEITNPRLVIEEDAGQVYGYQYIFLCDYLGGQVALSPDSIEFKINQNQQNIYTPKWLRLDQLPEAKLLPKELKDLILKFIKEGFPDKPQKLIINKDSEL